MIHLLIKVYVNWVTGGAEVPDRWVKATGIHMDPNKPDKLLGAVVNWGGTVFVNNNLIKRKTMKKNEAPGDSRLKSIENESPDQKKPRASQPDSSIRNDKDPLPANGGPQFGRDDVHSNENAEFIDRDNNVTKVEGEDE